MQEQVLIALDSGTSVVKAVAFDGAGNQLACASRPNTYERLAMGGAEQDMARTWDDAAEVLREIAADLAGRWPGWAVTAIAVTGQGDGTWLIDRNGAPAGPGLLWLDSRSAPFVERLAASGASERAYDHTGTGLAACQQVPQLLWLERHRAEMLERAALSLHPKDFLFLQLTGIAATSPDEACFSFGDFRTGRYSPEVLAVYGIERFARLLPPILDGTREARPLTRQAATRIGLPEGTPVVLGFVDAVCTTLGAGVYQGAAHDGETGVTVLGSTGLHNRLFADAAEVAPSPLRTGYSMVFPVPGHVLQAQSNLAATINLDWVANLAVDAAALATGGYVSRGAILRSFDESVLAARPGAVVYHPFISSAGERGPFVDTFARAALLGLDQDVRLIDLVRGVYEGLCFAARDCYAAIGGAPARVRVTGGAARSLALRTILAACLDRPVFPVAHEEAGAAGAAMIAAVQRGLYADMAACAATWITPRSGTPIAPDPDLAARYSRLFAVYRETYQAMPELWRKLHAAREGSAHAP